MLGYSGHPPPTKSAGNNRQPDGTRKYDPTTSCPVTYPSMRNIFQNSLSGTSNGPVIVISSYRKNMKVVSVSRKERMLRGALTKKKERDYGEAERRQ